MIKKIDLKLMSRIILIISLFSSLAVSCIYGISEKIGSLCNYSLFGLTIIYLIFLLKEKGFKDDKKDKVLIGVYVFLIGFLITVLFNAKLIDNAKLFILAIVQCYVIYKHAHFDRVFCFQVLKIFTMVVFLFNLISFVMYIIGFDLSVYSDRFCGIYSGPNIGSAVIAFSTCFHIVICFFEKKKRHIVFTILNIILCFFLLNTFKSRSGVIVFLAFAFMFPFAVSALKTRSFLKSIAIGVASILIVFGSMNLVGKGSALTRNFVINSLLNDIGFLQNGESGSKDERDDENVEASNFFRLSLLKYGIETGIQHPIIGVGDRNLADAVEANSPFHLIGIQGGGVHNIYVGVFVANGLIGLLSFLYILFNIMVYNLKSYIYSIKNKESDETVVVNAGLFVIFLCFLGYGLLESNLILSASVIPSLFWIVAGLVSKHE